MVLRLTVLSERGYSIDIWADRPDFDIEYVLKTIRMARGLHKTDKQYLCEVVERGLPTMGSSQRGKTVFYAGIRVGYLRRHFPKKQYHQHDVEINH